MAESRRGLIVRPLVVDLGRDYRGGQHQALLLLQGLVARGHGPVLITIRDSLLARRARDAGIAIHGVSPGNRRIAAALTILTLVRGRQVEVVHANEPHALTSAWLARAHRFVPLLVSRRIALPISSNFPSRARYEACSRIVAVSQFVAKSVAASGYSKNKIDVIYDGVAIPAPVSAQERERARKKFAIPRGATCIGNVAAFVPEKGQNLLIRAFSELLARHPNCVLLLAGEGPEKARLLELVAKLRLTDSVRFSGFVLDIQSVFAATDLFVFPSHEEPLGSSLLSAMSYGLPVVAIARGGIPEALEDAINGLLVSDLDAHSLAAAMTRLVSNRAEVQQFGEAARETIKTRFSADRMVEATLRLCESVTGAE